MTQKAFISKYVYFEIRNSLNIARLILTQIDAGYIDEQKEI